MSTIGKDLVEILLRVKGSETKWKKRDIKVWGFSLISVLLNHGTFLSLMIIHNCNLLSCWPQDVSLGNPGKEQTLWFDFTKIFHYDN